MGEIRCGYIPRCERAQDSLLQLSRCPILFLSESLASDVRKINSAQVACRVGRKTDSYRRLGEKKEEHVAENETGKQAALGGPHKITKAARKSD